MSGVLIGRQITLPACRHSPIALARSKCGFEKRMKTTFFTRSFVGIPIITPTCYIASVVVTIVQHRTRVLNKKARMCSKTSTVDNTKSVHYRSKLAVFVRTAQGLSSNKNEADINSKSDLWRTAIL